MRTLSSLDFIVIGVYLVAIFLIGIALTKKASKNMEEFFIGGRSMPWWLIGVSMAATNFSIDTPIAVTKFIYKEGIGGVWFMWSSAISAIFVTFFFSRLWRRSEVITDAEIIEKRYSGSPAKYLRLFKGVYFGVLFNAFIMGWVFLSLTKVMAGVTNIDISYILWISVITVFIYSILSGFYGVVLTDFFQYFLALIGSIILAVYSLKEVGGIGQLVEKIHTAPEIDPSVLNFIPSIGDDGVMPFSSFLVFFLVQWWAHKYADGGGKHIQRMLATKDETHSFKGSALFTVLTYTLQVWPWIITGLCALVLLNNIPDPEMAYSGMMARVLPHGLLGFVVVCLIGAFMSTIDTHLNLGASYIVNDIYKRFITKNRSQKHYVMVSRVMMLLLILLAVLISKNLSSVGGAWKFLLTFASGAGLTWIIRWFWWRANAWTEFSGMIASGVMATFIHSFFPDVSYSVKLLTTVSFSTVVWIIVTYLTPPVDDERLCEFVKLVRPGSPGWNRIYKKYNITPTNFLYDGIKLALLGIVAFFSFNFGVGSLIFHEYQRGTLLLLISFIIGYYIIKKGKNRSIKVAESSEIDINASEASPVETV